MCSNFGYRSFTYYIISFNRWSRYQINYSILWSQFIFLFVGGFIIALAIEKWNLHKRVALNIIKFTGTKKSRIILGFMIATAILSMFISNTATTIMILPVGMQLSQKFQ